MLIADDDLGIRNVMAEIIRADAEFELVGVARDAAEATRLAAELRPDVALVDVRMPEGGGRSATEGVLRLSPSTKVIALSALGDQRHMFQMLEAGATGYLVKGTTPGEIRTAIRGAAYNVGVLSTEVTGAVIGKVRTDLDRESRQQRAAQAIAGEIDAALHDGGLSMVFQPIAELGSGTVRGYEGLARFSIEPDRPPDVWFAEAAAIGMGVRLEVAAITRALNAFTGVPGDLFLAVNASPSTIVSGALTTITSSLGNRLVIEVTEHAPVPDYGPLIDALDPLRLQGARLAIDDAGAGFASLRHILRLRPDIIKLDISLTHGIDTDPSMHALATSLTRFAAETGAVVLAEGIETGSELESVTKLGATYGQGYLLGRPEVLS